jgi:hypothetical protein
VHDQLHARGWSVGDAAFYVEGGGLAHVVTGTNGKNMIRAESEAWRRAWRPRSRVPRRGDPQMAPRPRSPPGPGSRGIRHLSWSEIVMEPSREVGLAAGLPLAAGVLATGLRSSQPARARSS